MPEINTPEGGRLADLMQVDNLLQMLGKPTSFILDDEHKLKSINSLQQKYGLALTENLRSFKADLIILKEVIEAKA